MRTSKWHSSSPIFGVKMKHIYFNPPPRETYINYLLCGEHFLAVSISIWRWSSLPLSPPRGRHRNTTWTDCPLLEFQIHNKSLTSVLIISPVGPEKNSLSLHVLLLDTSRDSPNNPFWPKTTFKQHFPWWLPSQNFLPIVCLCWKWRGTREFHTEFVGSLTWTFVYCALLCHFAMLTTKSGLQLKSSSTLFVRKHTTTNPIFGFERRHKQTLLSTTIWLNHWISLLPRMCFYTFSHGCCELLASSKSCTAPRSSLWCLCNLGLEGSEEFVK